MGAVLTFLSTLFVFSVVNGTPLLYGTLGEILTEKSGNMNLGVEGILFMGGAAGLGGDLPYAAHVVKVPVGQQDRFHGQPQRVHLAQNLFRGVAGVDDTAGLRRTVVDDIAVGSVSPKGQRVNVQHTITYRV